LFKALGKTAKRKTPRRPREFYTTPDAATDAFVGAESGRLNDFPLIWEPACGELHLTKRLVHAGHAVHSSDILDRGVGAEIRSFYDYTSAPAAAIVTNPPFDQCNWKPHRARWIAHALDRLQVDYLALLLPWAWPTAGGMGDFYEAHQPARVYLMRFRLDFTGQGAPPTAHAWFVWDVAHQGETVLRMLDRSPRRQRSLF
jgi:hypothetical protein